MKINKRGLNIIKKYEGCRLTAYKCPAGVYTIGYGHTKGVKKGDTITQKENIGLYYTGKMNLKKSKGIA